MKVLGDAWHGETFDIPKWNYDYEARSKMKWNMKKYEVEVNERGERIRRKQISF